MSVVVVVVVVVEKNGTMKVSQVSILYRIFLPVDAVTVLAAVLYAPVVLLVVDALVVLLAHAWQHVSQFTHIHTRRCRI